MIDARKLGIQKPDTKKSSGNCNYEFGIESVIGHSLDISHRVVDIIKELPIMQTNHDNDGSAVQFLSHYRKGFIDTYDLDHERKQYDRQMDKLPSICRDCNSKNNCYTQDGKVYTKNEPK